MKRFVTLMLAAVLLIGFVLPMAACADETERLLNMESEERAARLMELAAKAIDKASCMRFRRSVDIRNPYYASFHTETESITYINGDDGITYISNSRDKTKLVSEGTFINRKWGYTDGIFFSSHEEGGNESCFKAPMSQEEFEDAYPVEDLWEYLDFLFDEVSCTTLTAEQTENGSWSATYEGFSEREANAFLRSIGYIPAFMTDTHDPKDMQVTLYMDAALRPVYLSVEVLFHKNKKLPGKLPTVRVTYDFIEWDEGELDASDKSVNLSSYTEIPDMEILDVFFGGLTAREQGSDYAFTIHTATTATGRDENGQPIHVTGDVTQLVDFSTSGGFRFTMEYEQEGKRHELTYAGGDAFLTVYNENGRKIESKSMKMLDAQAYDTVKNLINPMAISPADIAAAEVLNQGHGLYRYELKDDVMAALHSSLQAIFADASIKTVDVDAELEAEIRNGVLVSYVVTVSADLTVDGIPVFTDTTVTVTFPKA